MAATPLIDANANHAAGRCGATAVQPLAGILRCDARRHRGRAVGYAAHAVSGEAQSRLQTAAIFAFGHGVALAALAPQVRTRLARLATLVLRLGVLCFCGSLVANVLLHWPTTLAPAGGMLLIAGWILWAISAVRDH